MILGRLLHACLACFTAVAVGTSAIPARAQEPEGDPILGATTGEPSCLDGSDGCSDVSDPTLDEGLEPSSDAPPPAPPAPEPSPQPATSGDEYDRLLSELPNDFDINYRFSASSSRRGKRPIDTERSTRHANRLRAVGGTMVILGTAGLIGTVAGGLVASKQASESIESLPPTDFEGREAAIAKGEAGDKAAIIGGAVSGSTIVLGAVMLMVARSMRLRGDSNGNGRDQGGMASKTRTNLVLYGTLAGVYGVAMLAVGAGFRNSDDEKRKKQGRNLLIMGGVFTAISVPIFIALLVDRSKRKTARVGAAPLFVRGGGGLGVAGRF